MAELVTRHLRRDSAHICARTGPHLRRDCAARAHRLVGVGRERRGCGAQRAALARRHDLRGADRRPHLPRRIASWRTAGAQLASHARGSIAAPGGRELAPRVGLRVQERRRTVARRQLAVATWRARRDVCADMTGVGGPPPESAAPPPRSGASWTGVTAPKPTCRRPSPRAERAAPTPTCNRRQTAG